MMKARTNPNRASASVKAMPRNIVVRTMPADSGCRAMAVMALPTTMPIPIPGPMAAPPYTMPRPTAVRPFSNSPESCVAKKCSGASRCNSTCFSLLFEQLVVGMHGSTDVHGRENREDVGLQERDQQLEDREGDEQ